MFRAANVMRLVRVLIACLAVLVTCAPAAEARASSSTIVLVATSARVRTAESEREREREREQDGVRRAAPARNETSRAAHTSIERYEPSANWLAPTTELILVAPLYLHHCALLC